MITNDIKEQFIELRAKNYSYDKIAKQLKVSKKSLMGLAKEFELEINNAKAIEMDILRTKFCLTVEMKLEIYRGHIDRLKKEITDRSLDKITILKLFEMLDHYIELLEKESPSITFQEKVKNNYDLSEMLDFKTESWTG